MALTNPEWPIMHAIFDGVSRDQMMAKHKSNHIQVVYVDDKVDALQMLYAKALVFEQLGIHTLFVVVKRIPWKIN